jgi:hypothetical protein
MHKKLFALIKPFIKPLLIAAVDELVEAALERPVAPIPQPPAAPILRLPAVDTIREEALVFPSSCLTPSLWVAVGYLLS